MKNLIKPCNNLYYSSKTLTSSGVTCSLYRKEDDLTEGSRRGPVCVVCVVICLVCLGCLSFLPILLT